MYYIRLFNHMHKRYRSIEQCILCLRLILGFQRFYGLTGLISVLKVARTITYTANLRRIFPYRHQYIEIKMLLHFRNVIKWSWCTRYSLTKIRIKVFFEHCLSVQWFELDSVLLKFTFAFLVRIRKTSLCVKLI